MGDEPPLPGPQSTDQPLQFDRAELPSAQAGDTASEPGIVCRGCGAAMTTEYFDLAGTPVCEACRRVIERAQDAARGWPRFARAAAFGSVAAIAGASLYYAVIAITNFEIGLVAIVIGFMVGFAVRKGTGGYGSRRYQLLAVFLTYFAVGLAYLPLAMKQTADNVSKQEGSERATDTAADEAPTRRLPGGLAGAIVALLLLTLALPVLIVIGSLPSGLLSALIIGIGMRQAWRMTGAPPAITGPYRLGADAPTPAP
jgi:hypothetical protein